MSFWPKCHSGQSVTDQSVSLAKVSLAKVSLAKWSLWPKCHSGQSVPAKVSLAKVSFWPKCNSAGLYSVVVNLKQNFHFFGIYKTWFFIKKLLESWLNHHLLANVWEKVVTILSGNFNSGLKISYYNCTATLKLAKYFYLCWIVELACAQNRSRYFSSGFGALAQATGFPKVKWAF